MGDLQNVCSCFLNSACRTNVSLAESMKIKPGKEAEEKKNIKNYTCGMVFF